MPPTASNPVKISIVFGIVWAFLAAFIVSNIGKVSGYGNPGVFVSLLSGLLTGAGIGTGSYYLFKNINTSVASIDATAGKSPGGGFGGDWYDAITAGYLENQAADKTLAAATSLARSAQTLEDDINFVASATTCTADILSNAVKLAACRTANIVIPGDKCLPGTYSSTGKNDAPGGCLPCVSPNTVSADFKTCKPPASSGGGGGGGADDGKPVTGTAGAPCPEGTYNSVDGNFNAQGAGCLRCAPPNSVSADRKKCTFIPNATGCAATNLTADQLIQCIATGNIKAGAEGGLTEYQFQQLSAESGISVAQLKNMFAGINNAKLKQDWRDAAASGQPLMYPNPPPSDDPNAPAQTPAKESKSKFPKMTMGTAAAIGLPIAGVILIGLAYYYYNNSMPAAITGSGKRIFWISFLTFLLTAIGGTALGANTQIEFRNLTPQQQDERRKATYGLGAVALLSGTLAGMYGIKYGASGLTTTTVNEVTTNNLKFLRERSYGGVLITAVTYMIGMGLAVDKYQNGNKRASPKTKDAVMALMFTIGTIVILVGGWSKYKSIKAPYEEIRSAINRGNTEEQLTTIVGRIPETDKVRVAFNRIVERIPANAETPAARMDFIKREMVKVLPTVGEQVKAASEAAARGASAAARGARAGKSFISNLSGVTIIGAVLLLTGFIVLGVVKTKKSNYVSGDACPVNTYSSDGSGKATSSTSCIACPPGFPTTAGTGSKTVSDCVAQTQAPASAPSKPKMSGGEIAAYVLISIGGVILLARGVQRLFTKDDGLEAVRQALESGDANQILASITALPPGPVRAHFLGGGAGAGAGAGDATVYRRLLNALPQVPAQPGDNYVNNFARLRAALTAATREDLPVEAAERAAAILARRQAVITQLDALRAAAARQAAQQAVAQVGDAPRPEPTVDNLLKIFVNPNNVRARLEEVTRAGGLQRFLRGRGRTIGQPQPAQAPAPPGPAPPPPGPAFNALGANANAINQEITRLAALNAADPARAAGLGNIQDALNARINPGQGIAPPANAQRLTALLRRAEIIV